MEKVALKDFQFRVRWGNLDLLAEFGSICFFAFKVIVSYKFRFMTPWVLKSILSGAV